MAAHLTRFATVLETLAQRVAAEPGVDEGKLRLQVGVQGVERARVERPRDGLVGEPDRYVEGRAAGKRPPELARGVKAILQQNGRAQAHRAV